MPRRSVTRVRSAIYPGYAAFGGARASHHYSGPASSPGAATTGPGPATTGPGPATTGPGAATTGPGAGDTASAGAGAASTVSVWRGGRLPMVIGIRTTVSVSVTVLCA